MDVFNNTNRAQIYEFYQKAKKGKFLSFKPEFSNWMAN